MPFVPDKPKSRFVPDAKPSKFVPDEKVQLKDISSLSRPSTIEGPAPVQLSGRPFSSGLGVAGDVIPNVVEGLKSPRQTAHAGFAAAMVPGTIAYNLASEGISRIPSYEVTDDGEVIKTYPGKEYSGNLKQTIPQFVASIEGRPYQTPTQKFISSAAPYSRKLAVAANLGKAAPELAAGAFLNPTGIAGRLLALGFSADMVASSGPMFKEYAEEFYKPESEQDKGKMAELEAQIITTAGFAPLAAKHGVSDIPITKGDRSRLMVREIAKSLGGEPAMWERSVPEIPGQPKRQLGIPPVTAEPFLQPGVPELASAALRERTQLVPPEVGQSRPALQALRTAVLGIRPVTQEPVRLKTDVGGGRVSFAAEAEAPGIPNALQSVIKPLPESPIVQPEPKVTAPEIQTVGPDPTQLRTSAEILRDNLDKRDRKAVAEEVTRILSEQPSTTKAGLIDEITGVSKKKTPMEAAQRTIFDQEWDAALERLGAKPKPPGEPPAAPPAEPPTPPAPPVKPKTPSGPAQAAPEQLSELSRLVGENRRRIIAELRDAEAKARAEDDKMKKAGITEENIDQWLEQTRKTKMLSELLDEALGLTGRKTTAGSPEEFAKLREEALNKAMEQKPSPPSAATKQPATINTGQELGDARAAETLKEGQAGTLNNGAEWTTRKTAKGRVTAIITRTKRWTNDYGKTWNPGYAEGDVVPWETPENMAGVNVVGEIHRDSGLDKTKPTEYYVHEVLGENDVVLGERNKTTSATQPAPEPPRQDIAQRVGETPTVGGNQVSPPPSVEPATAQPALPAQRQDIPGRVGETPTAGSNPKPTSQATDTAPGVGEKPKRYGVAAMTDSGEIWVRTYDTKESAEVDYSRARLGGHKNIAYFDGRKFPTTGAVYTALEQRWSGRRETPTQLQKLEASAKAQAKMQEQVTKVAKTEGQRDAKEVKSELVSRLEEAESSAKSENDLTAEQRSWLSDARSGNENISGPASKKLVKSGVEKITISIPGDGTFTVWNTKEAIGGVLQRARKLQTATQKEQPSAFTKTRPTGNIPPDVWVNSSEPTHNVTTVAIVSKEGKSVQELTSTKGKPITIPGWDGVEFFLTSDGTSFTITEPRTGLSVGRGDTISKAKEAAIERLSEVGKEKLEKAVADSLAGNPAIPKPSEISKPGEKPQKPSTDQEKLRGREDDQARMAKAILSGEIEPLDTLSQGEVVDRVRQIRKDYQSDPQAFMDYMRLSVKLQNKTITDAELNKWAEYQKTHSLEFRTSASYIADLANPQKAQRAASQIEWRRVNPPATKESPIKPSDTAAKSQADRIAKTERLKQINSEAAPLVKKGSLTKAEAEKYTALMKEADDIRYWLAKPLDPAKVKPESERKSTIPFSIVDSAQKDLLANKDVYDAITEAASGVFHNADTPVDVIVNGGSSKVSPQQFYNAFQKTRDALRAKFGNEMTLFRAEGSQKPKATQNWATTREYARQFGENVVEKKVPVDDILAVNVGVSGNYHEIIVGKKPSDIVKEIADKVRKLKSGVDPKRGDMGTFNVIPKVWDAAIEVAAKIIEKGGSVADAINAALKHIRDNNEGKSFLEREARRELEMALQSRPSGSAPTPPRTAPSAPAEAASATRAAGDDVRMRTLSARGTTSEKIPEPVQQQIANAPESYYRQQSLKSVEQAAREKSNAELAATPRDSDSYTADRLELTNRLLARGKNQEAYTVFQELSADLTRMGQVINQAKLFQALLPENTVKIVNERLKSKNRDTLTPEQEAQLTALAKERIEATNRLDKATEEWMLNPTNELAAKAERLLLESNKAALKEQRFIHKFDVKKTFELLKTILQGNLLTPISQIANIVGNVNFIPFRVAARELGATYDMIDSFIRNRPRQIAAGNVYGSAFGAARGIKEIPKILAHGQQGAIKGEITSGLHPLRAWARQFARNPEGATRGGRITLGDRVNLAIEGTLGVPAEAMLRALAVGDAPFRGAARGRLIAEQANIMKIPKGQHRMVQIFPELFFDRKTMERINEEAAQAVFQGKSETISKLNSLLKSKGEFWDLLATSLMPYKLTPWNIIKETLSYNPLIAMAQTIRQSKNGNIRQAEMNAGKFVVGSMLSAAGWWLYQNGILAPSLDSKDEQQKARILSGEVLPPNHINLSALKRALAPGSKPEDSQFRPGDETIDTFRAGGLAGSVLYMMANIGRDIEKKPDQSQLMLDILKNSTIEQARFGMNQSFLKGVAGTVEAIQTGNVDSYIQQYANTVLSVPLPNTLSTITKANREYKPDISADKPIQQLSNALRNRLGFAGLDEQLTLKRGLWGEPLRETPKERNALLYHFFDIFKGKQVTDDPVPIELYRLWRKTSDTSVIPTPPGKVLTVDNTQYNLTPEQQSELSRLVGENRRLIVDSLVINPEFQKFSDEEKIKILNMSYEKGSQVGKGLFYLDNLENLTQKPQKAGFKNEAIP